MRRLVTSAAFSAFALCMVGVVAWPVWSDNDLWGFVFAAAGIAVLFPLIFVRVIREFLKASSSSPPTVADHGAEASYPSTAGPPPETPPGPSAGIRCAGR